MGWPYPKRPFLGHRNQPKMMSIEATTPNKLCLLKATDPQDKGPLHPTIMLVQKWGAITQRSIKNPSLALSPLGGLLTRGWAGSGLFSPRPNPAAVPGHSAQAACLWSHPLHTRGDPTPSGKVQYLLARV